MTELTNKQKKEWAKMIYMNEHLRQKEIAEKVGVSAKTLSQWVTREKWEEMRISVSATREEQSRNAMRQLAELNAEINSRPEGLRFASSKEADTILKLSRTISGLKEGVSVGDVINVSKGLLKHVRRIDPEKAKEISYYFESYIKELLQ